MLSLIGLPLFILLVLSSNPLHMDGPVAVHEISVLLASASSEGSGESRQSYCCSHTQ